MKILVLYDATQTYTNTVYEHLQSLADMEDASVYFAHLRPDVQLDFRLESFDCVIIHYSVRIAFEMFSVQVAGRIAAFQGLKALFIQDEYDCTEIARRWIRLLGLHLVFTCVPAGNREKIYPSSRFPGVKFVTNLTGYVPRNLLELPPPRPLSERTRLIGYRGRALGPWYGTLGQEKKMIGVRMRALCEARGLPVDIEWNESARIYGQGWYEFLGSCRATLGTESGANVFDDDGSLRTAMESVVRANPSTTFDQLFDRFLRDREQPGLMNQISPKVFEAAAVRTALILFEGTYSGVVQPDIHYIRLRKDFSNIDEVLGKLQDDEFVSAMTERAYNDIIASGTYGYQQFSNFVRATLSEVSSAVVAAPSGPQEQFTDQALEGAMRALSVTRTPVRSGDGDGNAYIRVRGFGPFRGPPYVYWDRLPSTLKRWINGCLGILRFFATPVLPAVHWYARVLARRRGDA